MGEPNEQRATRPRITLKYAQALDGRIATSTGHSQWVSCLESRTLSHRLRSEHDAVLVGVGTVLADDPLLTVRLWPGHDPLRIVLDSRLRTPASAAMLSQDGRTIIAATAQASTDDVYRLDAAGATVIMIPSHNNEVDLRALLERLWELGVQSVLVEGGSQVITSFLRLHLVDEVVIFIAPKIAGEGIAAVNDLGIQNMQQAVTFQSASFTGVGEDIMFRGLPVWDDS